MRQAVEKPPDAPNVSTVCSPDFTLDNAMAPQDSRTEGQPQGEAVHADPAAADAAGQDLETLLQKAESEAAEMKDAFLRARADSENARRQAQQDLARATKFAIEKFAGDLL